MAPKPLHEVMEALRAVLQEGQIDNRTQHLIEAVMKERRTGFASSQLSPQLDLVEERQQVTHDSVTLEVSVYLFLCV